MYIMGDIFIKILEKYLLSIETILIVFILLIILWFFFKKWYSEWQKYKENKQNISKIIKRKIDEINNLKIQAENNNFLNYKSWSFEICFWSKYEKLENFLKEIKEIVYGIENLENKEYKEVISNINDLWSKFIEFKNTYWDYERSIKYSEYKKNIIENENKILDFLLSKK